MINLINKKRVLGQIEIIREINASEKEGREVNLSNSIIPDLSAIYDKVKGGLNLENSEIKNSIFLSEITIYGDLNLKNSIIEGSLYLGNCKIKGDLLFENAKIKGAANLVGSEINGNINAKNATIFGFLAINKAKIDGDILLEDVKIKKSQYEKLIIRGDLLLSNTMINGGLDLGRLSAEGIIDMENTTINNNLVLIDTKSNSKEIDISATKLEGKKII